MAETKKEQVFKLFAEGKRPSDPEVKAVGLKSRSIYTYFTNWKKGSGTTTEEDDTTIQEPPVAIKGRAVEVGKITITPENWGMTQHGAILILDTYNKAKRDISYGGTIGEFLCDVCEFYRRVLNYKEVEYAGREGDGGRGVEKNGEKSDEPVLELAK